MFPHHLCAGCKRPGSSYQERIFLYHHVDRWRRPGALRHGHAFGTIYRNRLRDTAGLFCGGGLVWMEGIK